MFKLNIDPQLDWPPKSVDISISAVVSIGDLAPLIAFYNLIKILAHNLRSNCIESIAAACDHRGPNPDPAIHRITRALSDGVYLRIIATRYCTANAEKHTKPNWYGWQFKKSNVNETMGNKTPWTCL